MNEYIIVVELGVTEKYYFCKKWYNDLHLGHTVTLKVGNCTFTPAVLSVHHTEGMGAPVSLVHVSFAGQSVAEQGNIKELLEKSEHFNVGLAERWKDEVPEDWRMYRMHKK